MSYLNVSLDYFEHPKTLMLVGILGKGCADLPIRLWAYCAKFKAKEGKLDADTAGKLEAIINWWGEPGAAALALEEAGFIQKRNGSYFIHDWKDHQGHIWALQQRNKLVAKNRWENIRKGKILDGKSTSGTPVVDQNSTNGRISPKITQKHPFKNFVTKYKKLGEFGDETA